ncbi:methylase involved in ubiquinone/menaquinone biosynthesis [Sanguibacter keddieii DSM 10542]|uniref:Methylase involved in ubiquinone/menaquinone biosynthesis n=1 Tax=Sanguibacter keddieii (strain ATCC 51767 / DSM 10542 / NCFB 3025 / ST-74) TaxID=446469 RepID=D1BB95_SANKS|nr:class I SAM-dependent methyltransferase [Sanguibacter keddieii]ACZ20661.1 methylase involved in ubiquinone/menaquinone biosynthesis [Sanguibacter keddieii DSM 10542]
MMAADFYSPISRYYDLAFHGGDADLDLWRSESTGTSSILEVGCGTGRVLSELPRPARRVGLDISLGMLAGARERVAGQDVRLVQGDMRQMPFDDEQFELVIAPRGAYSHLLSREDLDSAAHELLRVCRGEGRVIVDIPDIRSLAQSITAQPSAEVDLPTKWIRTRSTTYRLEGTARRQSSGPVVTFDLSLSEERPEGRLTLATFSPATRVLDPLDVLGSFEATGLVRHARVVEVPRAQALGPRIRLFATRS